MLKQRPPQFKKQGRIVYRVKKGKDGYKEEAKSDSDMEKPKVDNVDIIMEPKPEDSVHSDSDSPSYGISLRVKESWEKSIHHTQEIASLLKEREKYFRGQLDQACYRTGPDGIPLYFPGSNLFPPRKVKTDPSATSQQAAAPTTNQSNQLTTEDVPQTGRSSGYHVTSEEELDEPELPEVKELKTLKLEKKLRKVPASVIASDHEIKPWDNHCDPEATYDHVQKWVTSTLDAMTETKLLNKSGISVDEDELDEIEEQPNRILNPTLSSSLKHARKYDANNFLGKTVLQSEMTRCGIPKSAPVTVTMNREGLAGARALLRQAEQALWASRKQEMLRHRNKNPLGYKRDKRPPPAPKQELSPSQREEAIKRLLEKPLPPSKMDFSHGDGVLLKTFSLINIDHRPFLDLKPKNGGRKGVIVPKMETLRQRAKIYVANKRSEPDLLAKLIPANYPRRTLDKMSI